MPGLPDPRQAPEFYEGVAVKRLVAFVVDSLLTLVLSLLILPFTAFIALFFFPFLWGAVAAVYRVVTLARGSATWGMRLMAIELREADGLPLRPRVALLHVAGLYLSCLALPVQAVSVGLMLLTERGQGLSDLVLGTAMINRPA
ncbi:MAG: RDD family protein [Rubellimicrobium sp.]|nr:RDD family protein [Rubellimicrobium sp.]